MRSISADYIEVTYDQAKAQPHTSAWLDPAIPGMQLELTDGELRRWRKGEKIAPFDALKKSLHGMSGSILEIGCGVGHCAEVISASGEEFARAAGLSYSGEFSYTGIDYSEVFIKVAKARRPWFKFEVMDALSLDYPNRYFDIAISSCCILHIIDWRRALKEACRVARSTVILHRTPTVTGPTRYFFKKAYGVECVEIHFNRQELLSEMHSHDFGFKAGFPVNEEQDTLVFERRLFHHSV